MICVHRRRALAAGCCVLLPALFWFGRSATLERMVVPPKALVIYSFITEQPLLALTFDDGPELHTPLVLDLLARYNAKATFFVLGLNVERRPETVKAIVDQGHQLGVHTYSHRQLPKIPVTELRSELSRSADLILWASGVIPTCFRPPYGELNPAVSRVVREHGYSIVMWTVDSSDWRRGTALTISSHVTSTARPGDIILMHDGLTEMSERLAALEMILEKLTAQGYRFLTIAQMLKECDGVRPQWEQGP
ncbi:MAG: polysaccharide deacetylase family protein [Bacillota bacterium]